ncbi:MAG TPA: NAD(P)/FAD-dependent oxidoreductase, partial [Limnochordia bacterium]|nr:NAD(P)/FAD-dependent oxidoreductase [Limnochordia bacterium]
LHKTAAGTKAHEDVRVPITDLLQGTNVKFVKAEAASIDPAGHKLTFADGSEQKYDKLVVALGSAPEFFGIAGLEQNGLVLRSHDTAVQIREHIEAEFRAAVQAKSAAERRKHLTVIVGGGGLTGVEFAGELADSLPELAKRLGLDPSEVKIVVLEALPEILRGFDEKLISAARARLDRIGVEVKVNAKIVGVEPAVTKLDGGVEIESNTFVWTGGVRGHKITEACLDCHPKARGRANVNEYLQSPSSPDIYVIGDTALAMDPAKNAPVPPTAQNAEFQGETVVHNLAAEINGGKAATKYDAKNMGVTASVGHGFGLAHTFGFKFTGLIAAWAKWYVTWRWEYLIGATRVPKSRRATVSHGPSATVAK